MTARLAYFDMTGLGEPVRLMLSVAKIPFSDIRVSKEEWVKLKPTLKWPHLPMLEIDGKVLFQSRAMCRYIARKAGLVGSTEEDALLADEIVDALEDMRIKMIMHYYKPDSAERDASLKKAIETVLPIYMKNFEELVANNGGYLVNGKLTWADVMFTAYADYLEHILALDMTDKYPKLKESLERSRNLPGVKEWRASRPKDPKDLRVKWSLPS